VHTELGSSQVDVQQCALSWAVGEEFGDELARLARRKWRWSKAEWEMEEVEASRRARRIANRKGGNGGGGGGGRTYILIKFINPYLADGEPKIYQIEYQKIYQIKCQNICQIKCQKIYQVKYQIKY